MRTARSVHVLVAGTSVQMDFAPGHEDLADEVEALWAHVVDRDRTVAASPAIRRFYTPSGVSRGGGPEIQSVVPGAGAAYAVSGDVTVALIEHLVGSRILLHAGVVDHDSLGVVMVVGESGAGKSTATLALGREGRYLTDELTILDPIDLHVTAYPKPISRRVGTAVKRDHSLAELGLVHNDTASRPDLVVFLHRGADIEPHLERVPHAEALLTLVGQSSSTWTVPGALTRLLELLEHGGGAVRAHYTEAADLPGMLESLPPVLPGGRWEALNGLHASLPPESRIGLFPVREAVAVDGGIVVLDPGRALHLTGVVAVVWHVLAENGPLTEDEVIARVVDVLGPHPQAAELVDDALTWLRREVLVPELRPLTSG
ncbi:hypothetical protein [Brachybacterium aquaticum]|uniref:Uncharacterized protein n=1 Tax=Brachybacterium aquaticum TaxID=1432564 RepID=A0A841AD15_9MICO|nr:hypothetical protein [Brachybacterium aquaticum]MBB5832736.1 hypothetical protein [Brachybacterium aquaticum]